MGDGRPALERITHICDGCSSWTDKPCADVELVEEWGWVFEPAEGEGPSVEPDRWYCPECQ